MKSRYIAHTVSLAILSLADCVTVALAEDRRIWPANAVLQFERIAGGEVVANFDLKFDNATGFNLCIKSEFVPGNDGFDATSIAFWGPRGRVVATPDDPSNHDRNPMSGNVSEVAVIFRGAKAKAGVRVMKRDYAFSEPGLYRAKLTIDIFDCSKLGDIGFISDNQPGWFLGHIVAEATAVLR
jgi:hypothetical protein